MGAFISICSILLFSTWLGAVSPKRSTYVLIALSPWLGLEANLGLHVTAYQIWSIPLIFFSLSRLSASDTNLLRFPAVNIFIFFAIWSFCITLYQLPFLPEAAVEGGWMRAPVPRALAQIVMFLLTSSPMFLIPIHLANKKDVDYGLRLYVVSLLALVGLGWVQLFIWYAFGYNFLPIGVVNALIGTGEEVRIGAFEFGDLQVYRMSSLGGEPKNLAAAIVTGMVLVQHVLGGKSSGDRPILLLIVWGVFASALFATSSTTGFGLWAVVSLVQYLASFLLIKEISKRGDVSRQGVMFFLIVGVAILVGALSEMLGVPVVDILFDRTFSRFEQSEIGILEDFDSAIIEYLLANPISLITGVGLGNVHLFADSYLLPIVAEYAGNTVFVAKAQYLRLLSEVGLIGFGIFVVWVVQLARTAKVNQSRRLSDGLNFSIASFFICITVEYLAAGSISAIFYILVGIVMSFAKAERTSGEQWGARIS